MKSLVVVVLWVVVCIFLARRMVKKGTGPAKGMVLGKDPEDVISEMSFVAQMAYNGNIINDIQTQNYKLTLARENGKIVKTQVRTDQDRTIITYTEETGEDIVHNGIPEKGAIALIALWLFGVSFMVVFFGRIFIGLIFGI